MSRKKRKCFYSAGLHLSQECFGNKIIVRLSLFSQTYIRVWPQMWDILHGMAVLHWLYVPVLRPRPGEMSDVCLNSIAMPGSQDNVWDRFILCRFAGINSIILRDSNMAQWLNAYEYIKYLLILGKDSRNNLNLILLFEIVKSFFLQKKGHISNKEILVPTSK